MNTLCIDTSEKRGSVAVRVDGVCAAVRVHSQEEDYSSWLIPAVEDALTESGKVFTDLDLLAVATGPGTFTGVRVGLCSVKAWAEVHGKPVVGVSRLEAMARSAAGEGLVTASYNAHRGQVYAGLYRGNVGRLEAIGTEMVISPAEFLGYVKEQSNGAAMQWLSLDPGLFTELAEWKAFDREGVGITELSAELANAIGEIAEKRAAKGQFTDVLALDANYVRRADAEIFWKGPSHRVGYK